MQSRLRHVIGMAALVICALVLWHRWKPRVIAFRQQADESRARVAQARIRSGAKIQAAVERAGLRYPPRELFLRAFKAEGRLEVFARNSDEAFRAVTMFAVLRSSGRPGPKRREGDEQVPEGFYRVDRFNPLSSFHLSLGLDYPNASDRVRSDRTRPGSDIFIHGKDVTIGCLPLGDEAIEELYLLALDTRERSSAPIHVHIFPARMSGPEWDAFRAAQPADLQVFWQELQPGFEAFEKTRLVPAVTVDSAGRYIVP